MIAVEWSEGFALPIAPLVLLVQGASFLLPRWWLRLPIASACCLAVYLMYQHVLNIELAPEEGANIGAGILAFEWGWSMLALVGALLREVVEGAMKWFRRRDDAAPSAPPD